MAIEDRDKGERATIRRQDDPADLAALTIERVNASGQYVWTGGRGSGTVQRKARDLIAEQRPDLFAWAFDVGDGQKVTAWAAEDRTWRPGSGEPVPKMIGWFGEGPRSN